MLVVAQAWLLPFWKTRQKGEGVQTFGVHEDQLAPGPGAFFTGFGHPEHGIQDGVDPQQGIRSEHHVALIDNVVAHGVDGVGLQNDAGTAHARGVGPQILGEQPSGMLHPAFRGTDGTHVRVMFREPHLIIYGAGTDSVGNEAGQLEAFRAGELACDQAEVVGAGVAPVFVVQVEFLEFGLVPFQQVLRIVDAQRIVSVYGVEQGHAAWEGIM